MSGRARNPLAPEVRAGISRQDAQRLERLERRFRRVERAAHMAYRAGRMTHAELLDEEADELGAQLEAMIASIEGEVLVGGEDLTTSVGHEPAAEALAHLYAEYTRRADSTWVGHRFTPTWEQARAGATEQTEFIRIARHILNRYPGWDPRSTDTQVWAAASDAYRARRRHFSRQRALVLKAGAETP